MSELKPCPFCNGKPYTFKDIAGEAGVGCGNCNFFTAGDGWNTRAPSVPVSDLHELIDAIIDLASAIRSLDKAKESE